MEGILGSHLNGVYCAEEILMRVNSESSRTLKKQTSLNIGPKVIVLGKGRTALECAHACARLGKEVSLIFPGTEEDIDVSPQERERAKQDGVTFEGLIRILALQPGEGSFVERVKCERMDFADPDSSGTWQLIPVPDSEFALEADTVILAIGNEANTAFLRRWTDLKINEDGGIWTDEETGMTSAQGVFAAGGAVAMPSSESAANNGGTEVLSLIETMVSGKNAARHIDLFLTQHSENPTHPAAQIKDIK